MMNPPIDADTQLSVEQNLLTIDGVLHASVDSRSGDIWVVHDPHHEPGPVELAVRNLLAASGHPAADVRVRVALPTASGPRRRVRFVDAARAEHDFGVTVTVSLEWNDVVHEGSASGERGLAVELKTSAQAALDSLEKLTGQPLGLRIIGVKQVHAFDSTIVVASIMRTTGAPQRLVGAVIVGDDPLRSAAVAVLSGLNRTLGNFLHTPG
jgi:hypothetical protein